MTATALNASNFPYNVVANIVINKLLTGYNFTDYNDVSRIKYIVIHYVGALGGAKANCQYYASQYIGASAHYYVGFEGEIWQSVEDEDIAWHVGASSYVHPECRNSNSIGIELCVRKKSHTTLNATDKDWYFEDATVKSAIALTKMLMKKYNIPADHVIRHYDVTGKICPNPYVYNLYEATWGKFKMAISDSIKSDAGISVKEYYRVRKTWADSKSQLNAYEVLQNAKNNCPAGYHVFDNKGNIVYTPTVETTVTITGTQATQITGTEQERAGQLSQIVHKTDNSGIVHSLTAGQIILESGYCTTELAINANNLFGMKCTLSGNTWKSVWDGKSYYEKYSLEYENGVWVNRKSKFRKYPCIEDSIKDHSLYLMNAMKGSVKRYPNINTIKNYETAIHVVKEGEYATDPNYVSKLKRIIEKYKLYACDGNNRTDDHSHATIPGSVFIVQTGAFNYKENATSRIYALETAGFDSFLNYNGYNYTVQTGAFKNKDNAEKLAKSLREAGFESIIKMVSR